MGAEEQSFVVRGGNEKYVKEMCEKACENDKWEHGNGGYTGSWADWNGRISFHRETFKTKELAHEYLFGKWAKSGKFVAKGVVEKWEDAIAVQFRNEKGQLNWLVGACFSC